MKGPAPELKSLFTDYWSHTACLTHISLNNNEYKWLSCWRIIHSRVKQWQFLASYESYYKNLTASHNKSLLWDDALHHACCYFQIPAGSERCIRSFLVSVTPDFQSDIESAGCHFWTVTVTPWGSRPSEACSPLMTNSFFSVSRFSHLDVKHRHAVISIWTNMLAKLVFPPVCCAALDIPWKCLSEACFVTCCCELLLMERKSLQMVFL